MVNWAEEWQVFLLGAQLALLVVAAIVAWVQVREAKSLREEQARPFVVVDFEMQRSVFYVLVITNLGSTLARDVRIEFSPNLATTLNFSFSDMKVFSDGIPTLAPGKSLSTLFDRAPSRAEAGLPMVYEAVVSYIDETRVRRGDKPYRESYTLDLEIFHNLMEIVRKDSNDVHKQLENMNRTFSKWSRSGGGLLAYSGAESKAENERLNRELQEDAEEAEWASWTRSERLRRGIRRMLRLKRPRP